MTLPTKNSGSGSDFEVVRYDNSTESVDFAVAALCNVLTPIFATGDVFSGWQSYLQDDCESAPVFADAGTLVDQDGENVGADEDWSEAILTFKSSNGGRGRFQMMEGVFAPNSHGALVGLGGIIGAVSDWLVSSASWVYARDNGKLVLPLNYTTKINDQLRKKYLF